MGLMDLRRVEQRVGVHGGTDVVAVRWLAEAAVRRVG
jgi:hypothetical protein